MNQVQQNIKIFISPRPSPASDNVYIANLAASLAKRMKVVNEEQKETGRSPDLLRHIFSADVLLLNWPEDTLNLRFGLLQALLFNMGVLLAKWRGATILWVCHNRKSHHKKYQRLNQWNRTFFKKAADVIVVHSEDAKQHLNDVAAKVVYLPHPRYEKENNAPSTKPVPDYNPQVLIWGSINPYKGLEAFIEQYKQQDQSFHTLIIGKAKNSYQQLLVEKAEGTNIRIVNAFVDDKGLAALFAQTKIVLLPYLHSDTFSSGALIHSINSEKIVIGPEVGNFRDLEKKGACITYKDYGMLFKTINSLLHNEAHYIKTLAQVQEGMQRYYSVNSWDDFAYRLQLLLKEKNTISIKQQTEPVLQNQSKTAKQPT